MSRESTLRATHSGRPQYFICLKNGRWRPVDVRAGEAPLAIWYRGCWRAVFRAVTDAEFFAAHPEAAWRFTTTLAVSSSGLFHIHDRDSRRSHGGDGRPVGL
jgi:hypothetical protein